jgi:hypothetical protein
MPLYPRKYAHPSLPELPNPESFRHLELADENGIYAAAALAEHPDCLELHLTVLRYGPRVARHLQADVAKLRALAKRLGKARVVGLMQNPGLVADARWFKFTRLFGFTRQRLYQCAELAVDDQ